jgi:hypothetical protein
MVVKLKPQWESKTKAGNDKTGWKRGAVGIDGLYDADGRDFMKSADPAFDKVAYGSGTEKRRADAIFDLTDRFKGAKGIDAGEPDHGDDGVR